MPYTLSRLAALSAAVRRRYALDPLAPLSPEDRLLVLAAPPVAPRARVALAALLTVLVLLLPALLVGLLLGALVGALLGLLVALVLLAVPAVVAGWRAAAPLRDSRRAARLRSDLSSEHLVDLQDPRLGWVRRGRMVSALAVAETARTVAETTGQYAAEELLAAFDRDAWRVVRLSHTAALLDPDAAAPLDAAASELLESLRSAVSTTTALWARCDAAVLGDGESLVLATIVDEFSATPLPPAPVRPLPASS